MFGTKTIALAACVALALGQTSASPAAHLRVRVHTKGDTVCDGEDASPMSVEGVEGVFCVYGDACVADKSHGACPSEQEGLEYGAYCDIVKTGVYGCKPYTEPQGSYETGAADYCDGEGESPMSVEGVEGIFCVTGQACVADIADGACPGPQDGLKYGASCGVVKTGVYGCKPNSGHKHHHHKSHHHVEEETVCDGEGQSPMSVEGVEGVFCVSGQACVADKYDGACPGEQEGLKYGAYCDIVKTGVYGCKPYWGW